MSSKVQKIFILLGNVNEQQRVVSTYHFLVAFPARVVAGLGIGPTALNFTGLICGVGSAIFIASGNFIPAFALVLTAGLADALDGAVARHLGVASDFGNFVDSVFDRYVDTSILLGILWYYASLNQKTPALLASLAMVGTVVTSYAKARGESLGVRGRSVGFLNRPERILIYLAGLLFPFTLPFLLWPLGIFSNLTAIHRIIFYTGILRGRQRVENRREQNGDN
jgi:phosphatidylglycerophosphate synthase